jgi:hypothetical protein
MLRTGSAHSQDGETCPRCGGSNLAEVPCVGLSIHHARLTCLTCKRHVRFLEKPWSLQRARAFVMPFGRCRGQRIGELAKSHAGRDYLTWLAENVDGNAAKAAEIVLRGSVEGVPQ